MRPGVEAEADLGKWADELLSEPLEEDKLDDEPSDDAGAELAAKEIRLAESPSDVSFFLATAGRYPLLTADQEKDAAKKLWSARRRLVQTQTGRRRVAGTSGLVAAERRATSEEELAGRLASCVTRAMTAVEPAAPGRGR